MDEALDILDEIVMYDDDDEPRSPSDFCTQRERVDFCQRIANAINSENVVDV